MVVIISDITDLAKLGLKYLESESKWGICHWIGSAPTSADIDLILEKIKPQFSIIYDDGEVYEFDLLEDED